MNRVPLTGKLYNCYLAASASLGWLSQKDRSAGSALTINAWCSSVCRKMFASKETGRSRLEYDSVILDEKMIKKTVLAVLSLMVFGGSLAAPAYSALANARSPGLQARSVEGVLDLRPEEVDLATAALIISERWSQTVYGLRCHSELDAMATEIQDRLRAKRLKADYRAIPVINEYLFDELGFEAVSEADDPNDLFLHTVLAKRKGYCLSLSVLYLSIGERLGLPVHGVVVPGHFFARYDDKRIRFNIETVAGGASPTDAHYVQKYKVPKGDRYSIYMKNLDKIQTLGCFFNNLGIVYSEIGNDDSSLETLLLAVEINPVLSESRSSLGNAYLRKGHINEAVYQYEKALEINPNDPKTHNNLGNAYTERGWTNYAVSQYLAAIQLDPKLADAHKNLARAYVSQKRYSQAISQLKNLLAVAPDDADCYSQIGYVYQHMDKCAQAVTYYTKALGMNPDLIAASCGLAACYNTLGQVEDEIKTYEGILARDPEMLLALVNLGNAYFQQEKYDQALAYYLRAAEVQPDDASILYNIGAAYFNRRMYQQANTAYEEAIAIDPKLADAHYGLAVGLYNLGQFEKAWKHVNIAKELGAKVTQQQLDAIKSRLR